MSNEELTTAHEQGVEAGVTNAAGCTNPYEDAALREQWREGYEVGVTYRIEDTRTPYEKRHDDTMALLEKVVHEDAAYSKYVIYRLNRDQLLESVPRGAATEGGGVLISATRLRWELHQAYWAGRADERREGAE